MTLAEYVTTFGPTLGFLIYLYVTRPPKAEVKDSKDDATELLRQIDRRLVRIEAILDERK